MREQLDSPSNPTWLSEICTREKKDRLNIRQITPIHDSGTESPEQEAGDEHWSGMTARHESTGNAEMEHKDRTTTRSRRIALRSVAVAAFLVPLILFSLTRLRMYNNVAGWLPDDDLQAEIIHWYQETFPQEERILVSWDDCSVTDPRIPQFARVLGGIQRREQREGGSPYIDGVTQPATLLARLPESGTIEDSLRKTVGLLTGNGPLCLQLSETASRFSTSITHTLKTTVRERFGVELRQVTRTLPVPSPASASEDDEKLAEIHIQLAAWRQALPDADLQFEWDAMHLDAHQTELIIECIEAVELPADDSSPAVVRSWFVPGAVAAISVSLSAQGLLEKEAAVNDIRAAAAECGIPAESLRMGGSTIAGTAVDAAVRDASWNRSAPVWKIWQRSPMALAAIAGFFCSWLTLRSFKLASMVQGVSIFVAALATALIVPMGASMNMVLIVMPTLLLVITVSGAIHLCNYWKKSSHQTAQQSVKEAVSHALMPCVLAASTTAIGLASLLVSNLVPVREFGLFSAIGCFISVAGVLLLLPAALLHSKPPQQTEAGTSEQLFRSFALLVTRHYRFHIVTSLGLTAVAGFGLQWFRTETKAIRYFPDDARIVADYEFLEHNLSGIVPVDTIVSFSREQQEALPFDQRVQAVLRLQNALEDHPEVSGALSLASFLDVSDWNSASRMARMKSRKQESMIRNRITGPDSENTEVSSMIAVADTDLSTPGDAGITLQNEGDEIWRISCQSSILSDCDYRILTSQLNQIAADTLGDLDGGMPRTIVTGMVPIFMRTQEALLESLVSSFGLAVVLIACVMACMQRSIPAALLSMIPNITPVIMVFGILCWADVRVDTGTMITASIALGLAVDGTLHLINCFRTELRKGLSQQAAATEALVHCGPALLQTTVVVGLGMFTLFPVELLLISRFGWVMATLVLAAFWGDFIVLPALLAGPLGRILAASANNPEIEAVMDYAPLVPVTEPVPQQVLFKGPHFVDSAFTTQSTPRSSTAD